jgi:hypothetical protein
MKKILTLSIMFVSVGISLIMVSININNSAYVSSYGFSEEITTAIAGYDANNIYADSAPKQQVVNGWVAKDLLKVATEQNAQIIENQSALGDIAERTNQFLMFISILILMLIFAKVIPELNSLREKRLDPDEENSQVELS